MFSYTGNKPYSLQMKDVTTTRMLSVLEICDRVEVCYPQLPWCDCDLQVDGVSLEGFSNEEAVDVLRRTGHATRLKLARHRYGSKYEQLLHAAAVGELILVIVSSFSSLF